MKIVFEFMEPARLHTKSDRLTTAEVAIFLEKKYELLESFSNHSKAKIYDRLMKVVQRYFNQTKKPSVKSAERFINQQVGGWLQNEWREYINLKKHGIDTKIAKEENRKPFVDTGDYFKSMIVRIKLV